MINYKYKKTFIFRYGEKTHINYKPFFKPNTKRKTISPKIEITIMCDYCADGLWLNGGAISINHLPKNVRFLEKRILDWQYKYEFFYNFNNLRTSKKFKKHVKEGYDIACILRNILPSRYKVIYFDERNAKRYTIKRNDNKRIFYPYL